MPKPVGTNPNKPEHNPLFPPTLRGRKLRPNKYKRERDRLFFEDYREDLRNYLKTENPEYLFIAIYKNERILQGERRFLKSEVIHAEEFDTPPEWKKSSTIDEPTIVWESIDYWQQIIMRVPDRWVKTETGYDYRLPYLKKAQDNLTKIGTSLIPRPRRELEMETEDGLLHVYPKYKGSNAYITYINPEDFINRYEKIRKTFKERSKKPRFHSEKREVREVIDIFSELDEIVVEDLEGFPESVNLGSFISSNTGPTKKTTAYISLVHRYTCRYCVGDPPGHDTIYNLYRKAKKELRTPKDK